MDSGHHIVYNEKKLPNSSQSLNASMALISASIISYLLLGKFLIYFLNYTDAAGLYISKVDIDPLQPANE